MDEPSGKTFGASGSEQETNDDLDLGKPWDFLGVDWARNQIVKIKTAIRGLESKVEWIQQSGGEAQVEIERRITELEVALTNYGIPLRASAFVENPLDDVSWPTKEHDDAVREAVLNEAAERVVGYMKGHWSEASVRGVVAALRGEDDSRIITDHAFRYSSPDRRHCSYRKNHRGMPCGALRSEHTYAQAQPEGPIRPV